jgi:hypothetical protein
MDLGAVDEFARSAVGLCGVEYDLSLVAYHVLDGCGEIFDGDFYSMSGIDYLSVIGKESAYRVLANREDKILKANCRKQN